MPLIASSPKAISIPYTEETQRYREMLDEMDLGIARKDRARRRLARERTRTERSLEEIEKVLEIISGGDANSGEFFNERNELQERLDEIDLAIARLDRERKQLRKERKKVEVWVSYDV